MSDRIYYRDLTVEPQWENWVAADSAPEGLPAHYVEDVARVPQTVGDYFEAYDRVAGVCGPEVIQFSKRVAIRDSDVVDLSDRAQRAGLELALGPADIADRQGAIRLGYLQLAGSQVEYPDGSIMRRGMEAGHCLLVRTSAILPPATGAPANLRYQADLDTFYVDSPVTVWPSWRIGRGGLVAT